jgi:GAF domain-containing protein
MSFTGTHCDFADKPHAYGQLARDLEGLLAGERNWIANAANAAALVFDALPDLNWAGFYVPGRSNTGAPELVVGPFQGKPACVRIAMGRGVCGTAAARRATIVVPDVHAFEGHIACDAASRSEIVVPLLRPEMAGDAAFVGVFDLDSPRPARFDDADRAGLERLAAIIVAASDWP